MLLRKNACGPHHEPRSFTHKSNSFVQPLGGRLRILFQYLASGAGGGMSNVALLLRAMAHEFPEDTLDLACTRGAVPDDVSGAPNVRIHIIGGKVPLELQRVSFETRRIRQFAKQLAVDVIWSLNIGPYIRTGIPQVLSLHNAFQVYPWEDCARYHPSPAAKLAALRLFFRRSLQCSDGLIVQTPLMEEYVRRIAGVPRLVISIPKAVEGLADLQQAPAPEALATGSRPGVFRFLYVSTMTPHKNHLVLMEAMRLLCNRGLNVQLVLTLTPAEAELVGGGLARELSSRGHLLCIGWVSKQQLRSVYDQSDACVMPSLLESLSSCHLEAMAWSKPQLVSDCPFARDTCGDAAVFVPNSPLAWSRQMVRLMNDQALRMELVERGRRRITAFPPTWRDVAARVRKVLQLSVQRAAGFEPFSPDALRV